MTRQHFETIAATIKTLLEISFTPESLTSVQRLADQFANFNPKFDRARFLKACGVKG